jgi:GH25 family lysozyme M1 (1,4-beta-N-acetylmuramidase)
MNGLYDAFADEVGKSGYECMLYGSKIYLEDLWEDRDTRKIWLAHYADETDYKGRFMLWQKADTGRIDGIEGDVDLNILYSKDNSGK